MFSDLVLMLMDKESIVGFYHPRFYIDVNIAHVDKSMMVLFKQQ